MTEELRQMRKAVLFLCWLVLAVPCAGEIIIVDDGGYGDFDNIQAAIDDSNNGDIIYVLPGTYTGPGNRDIDFGGRAITVTGVEPQDPYFVAATVIDCNGSAAENHRGFLFISGEDGNSILTGLTITNGYAIEGGGVYCVSSSPTITNCVLTNNAVDEWDGYGGGICSIEGQPTIVSCLITGNSARQGGGVSIGGGIIENCTINSNIASRRGGGMITGSTKVTQCTITENTAPQGGGLYSGSGLVENSTISRNGAPEFGGGLVTSGATVVRCTITGNCSVNGGGVYNMSDSEPITSCFIYCNTATGYGGGIYNWGSISTITNCTIGANTAGNNGGGVYNTYNDSPTLVNCVLWGNSDSTGMGELAQMQGLTPGVFYSCIQDDDPNDGYIAYGGETNHNIDDNPLFVRDPNDGGDGWGAGDNDDFGDLHLQSGSPCVDTGDPYLPILPQETDIDGEARLMGGRVDMGADEFLVPVLPTIAVTKPDEGAVWACESIHQIEWSSYGAGYVDILFSSDDGNNWQEVDNGVEDACSYTWHLPDGVDSNQCLVLVAPSVPDANVVCIESGLFTIHPDSPGPPIVSKWESLGGDYDRKGLSDNYGPVLGCVKWEFEVDGAISASVTVGPNDTVYVPCEDGNLYKLDANGVVLWTYEANSPLITSPSIGPDGTVYVGAENGRLHAVDIDGNLRWTHGTGGMVYSSPAVSADGNTIFVGSQDGKLYALGNDGSELWSFETDGFGVAGGAILSSPSIGSNGTVYVAGLYDPNLYALDPNDGSVKWVCHFDSKGWPFASPVVAPDGTIYQTLVYDSNLYAIEPNDGSVRWATNLSDIWKQSSDSYSRWFEPCYYLSYRCSILHGHAHFHYYEAQYDVSESGFSEPVLGPDGTIYVSLDDPYVRAVEPNGTIKWIRKPGPRSTYTETDGEWGWGWYDTSTRAMGGFGLTVGSNGSIYAASNDGNLYVINPDGFEIARFDSNDYWLAFPVVSADNTLIVGDSRDNSMLISYENNKLWAVADKCQGQDPNLCWQGGAQDLRGDGTIDFIDFSILGQEWLKCTDCCPLCPCYWDVPFLEGDINRDFYVDFADLSMLAEQWLSGH